MKKVISVVIAILMLSVCFASCSSAPSSSKQLKVVNVPLTEERYAFAVNKGDTEELEALNAFLADIKANGTFDEIMNKYFGDGEPSPVSSATEMKTDGSQLIVATNAAFEPFEYMKGANYYGVDMEIMNLYAQATNRELYIFNENFDAVCLSVSAAGGSYVDDNGNTVSVNGGVCDIAASGLTVKPEREKILDFSTSYYNAAQVIITSKDDTTFDECTVAADVEAILSGLDSTTKVGVQNGTTGYFYCVGDADFGFAGYSFSHVGYPNGALAAQNILNGNLDFVIIDEGPANAIVKNVNAAN